MQLNIKPFLDTLKNNGISLVWIQDPISKLPSVSLSNLVLSIILVDIGLFSNYFTIFKGISFSDCFSYFIASVSFYTARKFSFGSKTANSEKVE
jgi:hypothetical protein